MKIRDRLPNLLASLRNTSMRIHDAWQFVTASWKAAINFLKSLPNIIWVWLREKTRNLFHTLNHPVFYSTTITILVILIYGTFFPMLQSFNLITHNSDTMQKSIEWVGVLYSLLISMILIRSWERLENTGNLLAKEAHTLMSLFDSACLITTTGNPGLIPDIKKIVFLIRDYVTHVEEQYESEYEDCNRELEGNKKIEAIKHEIELILKESPSLHCLNLTQKLEDVTAARRNRLLSSKVRMPFPISVLLYVSSILWLGLFTSVSFDNIWLTYVFIGGLTFIVITITSTVLFFYEPININWNDISGSWKELKSKI